MVLAEQIKEAASRRDTLEKCLDIERKRMDLQNEEEKTQEPDFWDDAARAQEQLRRVASIKSWITDYDTIRKEVEDAISLRLVEDPDNIPALMKVTTEDGKLKMLYS